MTEKDAAAYVDELLAQYDESLDVMIQADTQIKRLRRSLKTGLTLLTEANHIYRTAKAECERLEKLLDELEAQEV